MPNMSYCRFENTLNDLIDCRDALHDDVSESEHVARRRLVKVCADILEQISLSDEDFSEIVQQADYLPVDDC